MNDFLRQTGSEAAKGIAKGAGEYLGQLLMKIAVVTVIGAIVFGIGAYFYNDIRSYAVSAFTKPFSAAKDAAIGAKDVVVEKTKEVAADAKEAVKETTAAAREKTGELAEKVREKTPAVIEKTGELVESASEAAKDKLDDLKGRLDQWRASRKKQDAPTEEKKD
ncbi:MAG TPA: hypothetical protein VJB97_02490 [Candidatus Paceibacterota bacterium]